MVKPIITTVMVCSLFFCFVWAAAGKDKPVLGYTYQRRDGNRYVEGTGGFPNLVHVDVRLDGHPKWIVAAAHEDVVVWIAVMESGDTQTFMTRGGSVTPVDTATSLRAGSKPPLLVTTKGRPRLLESPDGTFTQGLLLPKSGQTVGLSGRNMIVMNDNRTHLLKIDALPDARILLNEEEHLLVLTDRTREYRHGILGDSIETRGVTLVIPSPIPVAKRIIEVPKGSVIEETAPIWSDLDGDGVREIILTVSDRRRGSRFMVFDNSGHVRAAGPAVGQGFRWRHHIAVAPFGPAQEMELAGVRTPHIGGILEFFRLEGEKLTRTAHIEGYSSHKTGSRNLDMAAAGDFDGDGHVELILPVQSFDKLAAVRRTVEGAARVWELPLPGKLTTNLSAVTLTDGSIVLGVGTDSNMIRFWLQQATNE